jgi:prepilin-type processing-associated H-X9-DG protein
VDEFDGYLPPIMLSEGSSQWTGRFWQDLLEDTLPDSEPGIGPSYERNEVLYCPREENTHHISDYGNNPYLMPALGWPSLRWGRLVKLSSVPRTDDLLLAVDSRATTSRLHGSWYVPGLFVTGGLAANSKPYPPRHGVNMNVLWVDLHIEALHVDDILNNRERYFDPNSP